MKLSVSRLLIAGKKWGIALLLLLQFALPAAAQDIPPRPNPPRLVNDNAHMMSEGEAQELEAKLKNYSDSTSNQVAIITLDNIGNWEPGPLTFAIIDAWGIGMKGKDNGVLILVSKEDRKVFIGPGRGLEGALPDVYCKRIIENILVPNFKQQQYYQGLNEATDAIIKLAAGEFVNDVSKDKSPFPGIIIAVIIISVIMALIFIFRGPNSGGGFVSGRGWVNSGPIIWGAGGGGSSWGGSSGGGGFGGFGGGSSGGGGAGGSW